jgi:hypothetical protein
VEIVADTPGPAVLVLADTYYPGWQAIVDSRSSRRTALCVRCRSRMGGTWSRCASARRWCWPGGLMSLGSIALLGLAWKR